MIDKTEIDRLRTLAVAATPGPWIPAGPSYGDAFPRYFNCVVVESESDDSPDICNDVEHGDADYIAAANPATLIALLDALEAAQADAALYHTVLDMPAVQLLQLYNIRHDMRGNLIRTALAIKEST